MQHPVMRPAKPKSRDEMIGIADKTTIGEENELDRREHWRARFGGGRERRPLRGFRNVPPARHRIHMHVLLCQQFMSAVLPYFRMVRTRQALARQRFFH
jgi:hypothetical protein